MKRLCSVAIAVLLALATSGKCEDAKDKKDAKGDDKALEGSWVATAAEFAGMPLEENVYKAIRLVLKDGKYTVTIGPNTDEGTTKVDSAKKTLDITGVKGPNMGKTILALYELKGDTLRVSYDLTGKAHPTEFKTKPMTQTFVATYKREKK